MAKLEHQALKADALNDSIVINREKLIYSRYLASSVKLH
jgi:hypothetical protein